MLRHYVAHSIYGEICFDTLSFFVMHLILPPTIRPTASTASETHKIFEALKSHKYKLWRRKKEKALACVYECAKERQYNRFFIMMIHDEATERNEDAK
jgi:hypothetical protein